MDLRPELHMMRWRQTEGVDTTYEVSGRPRRSNEDEDGWISSLIVMTSSHCDLGDQRRVSFPCVCYYTRVLFRPNRKRSERRTKDKRSVRVRVTVNPSAKATSRLYGTAKATCYRKPRLDIRLSLAFLDFPFLNKRPCQQTPFQVTLHPVPRWGVVTLTLMGTPPFIDPR